MEKPKVLHISTPTTWRGGEQQLAYLVSELIAQEVPTHVLCASGGKVESFCRENQIPHTTCKERFAVNPLFAKAVRDVCISHSIDIIHVHDSHAHTFAVMAATLFGNPTPIIVSRRVDFPISRSWLSHYKYNHPLVKRIVCVSDAIRQIVARDIKRPELACTVYSGIDTSRFTKTEKTGILHREMSIPEGTPLIGNVAALAPHKDYRTFIATAQQLVADGAQARFLIIGDGPLKEEVTQWVADSGISDQVLMLGFRKDIPEILPELDVFLITSETEGLGTSILDAFACRVPVVATDAGGIPEIVRHNETGFTGKVKDPTSLAKGVSQMLADKTYRDRMVNGATQLLSTFHKSAMAQSTWVVYREVLGGTEA